MNGPIKKIVVKKYGVYTWEWKAISQANKRGFYSSVYKSKHAALNRARQIAKQLGCPVEIEE